MKKFLNDCITICEKEILLALRFKLGFFFDHLVGPIIRIIPFLLIYQGVFFFIGTDYQIGQVSSANFIVYLLIGMLLDVYFTVGSTSFTNKFMSEKYWQTIEAMLLAPINKFTLIIGVGLSDALAILPNFLIFGTISYLILPIGLEKIVVILLLLALFFLLSLSIGLVFGSIALFNEGLVPLTGYIKTGILFLSCFYYPISLIPVVTKYNIFQSIAKLNPIYQGGNILREVWINGAVPQNELIFETFSINPLLYFMFFAIIAAPIAVFVFEKLWKLLGIQGY